MPLPDGSVELTDGTVKRTQGTVRLTEAAVKLTASIVRSTARVNRRTARCLHYAFGLRTGFLRSLRLTPPIAAYSAELSPKTPRTA